MRNIIIHDRKRQRYRCKRCKQTFSARRGTMFEDLRKPMELIVIVVTLLSYGCAAQPLRPLLVLTDRWAAYPGSIRRAFREKVKKLAGVGRASLEVWPQLCIGTVIKRAENKRVVEITRQMAHGLLEQAEQLLQLSGGKGSQYRFYRTLEWNHAGATGKPNAQMSALRFAPASLAHGHVPDWLYLQFLCGPSGIEPSIGQGLVPRRWPVA